jgi:hypothetical protein
VIYGVEPGFKIHKIAGWLAGLCRCLQDTYGNCISGNRSDHARTWR